MIHTGNFKFWFHIAVLKNFWYMIMEGPRDLARKATNIPLVLHLLQEIIGLDLSQVISYAV
jgi:hypothetical protein